MPTRLLLTLYCMCIIVFHNNAQITQICNDEPANLPTHIAPDCYEGTQIIAAGDPNCPDG